MVDKEVSLGDIYFLSIRLSRKELAIEACLISVYCLERLVSSIGLRQREWSTVIISPVFHPLVHEIIVTNGYLSTGNVFPEKLVKYSTSQNSHCNLCSLFLFSLYIRYKRNIGFKSLWERPHLRNH